MSMCMNVYIISEYHLTCSAYNNTISDCSTILFFSRRKPLSDTFTINFNDMSAQETSTQLILKRLSTKSSGGSQNPEVNETVWKWHWLENDQLWKEFASPVRENR